MIVDDLFGLVSYKVNEEPHIRVNREICQACVHRACTFMCPAKCYQWNEVRQRIEFAYEPCLECGTCLLICDRNALDWNFPRGGFGVRYRVT